MKKCQHNSDYLMGSFNRLSRLVKYSLFHKLQDIIEAIRPQLPCIIVYVNSENICDASRDPECVVAMA